MIAEDPRRALLCVAHAAELDWVSAYRTMLAAMP
jgi:hypothetical protein